MNASTSGAYVLYAVWSRMEKKGAISFIQIHIYP